MKILIAADGSSHSHDAIALLKQLKVPADSEIVLLNVLEDFRAFAYESEIRDQVHEQLHERRKEEAVRLLDEIAEGFVPNGFCLRTEIREGHVADEITRLAEQEKADLVVVGSRGLSALDRFLSGSTSQKVLKHAPSSVLLSRPGDTSGELLDASKDRLRIQLCWDGSPACDEALATLTRLPLGQIADVRIVSVMSLMRTFRMDILQTMSEAWRSEQLATTEAVEKAAEHLRAAAYPNVMPLIREADDVSEDLLNVARGWHADLIMIGSSGKSAIDRFLLGGRFAAWSSSF
jgi:nucleotide-binding universal stress UspA family protein